MVLLRNLVLISSFFPALFIASPAEAQNFEFEGLQFQGVISADLGLSDTVGLHGQMTAYGAPWGDVGYLMFHIGPSFLTLEGKGSKLTLAPQIVGAAGWFHDAPAIGLALIANLSLFDGKMTAFLESDVLIDAQGRGAGYYGYYAADGVLEEHWNFGGQIEQVNGDFLIGPHVGWKMEFFRAEAQYFLGPNAHAFRLIAALTF